MNIASPPAAVSFMSYFVLGRGSCGIGASSSARQSAPVKTPSTPGMARALVVSILRMRACGWGERTIAANVSPASLKSSLKRPWPVTRRASSWRGIGLPMKR